MANYYTNAVNRGKFIYCYWIKWAHVRYSQHNLPFCSIVSSHKCFFKVLMVVQETPASYPLRCDVNTSESMLLISKAMREKVFRPCSRFTIFTIIISIRPCLRKKIPSSYKTRQCRGSTGVLDHHFFFFFFLLTAQWQRCKVMKEQICSHTHKHIGTFTSLH